MPIQAHCHDSVIAACIVFPNTTTRLAKQKKADNNFNDDAYMRTVIETFPNSVTSTDIVTWYSTAP